MRHLILPVLLLLLAGCATDPVPPNNEMCPTDCTVGESRCSGSTVQACAPDADGCPTWVDGLNCRPEGLLCDDSAAPAVCLAETGTCDDGAQNQDESDIDCGGARCAPCAIGGACEEASDCASGNCDAGGTDQCVEPDAETCTDGEQNRDETDVDCGGAMCAGCEEGEACSVNADCASSNCDGGTCGPDMGGCTDGDVQCSGTTLSTCANGAWEATAACAQGCDQNACADTVQCTAGEDRCYRNSVQRCNVTGTGWVHDSVCADDCDAGLCIGACTPGENRCNGDALESCNADGATWAQVEACAMGCANRTCRELELDVQGVEVTLSGPHVYQECVTVELGGTIRVPAGETLEIWARCFEVTSSSFVTLEAGARLLVHAMETVVNDGTIAGGDLVRLSGYQSLTNNGSATSATVQLRGDVLTIGASGSTGGGSTFALYGTSLSNQGAHTGAESVMPPEQLSSPTHPAGWTWNLNVDDVSVAWDRPFASVMGYYVAWNSNTPPGPANGEYRSQEQITIPLSEFGPGRNWIEVVSVNADSTVGTVPVRFEIDFNVAPPTAWSTSHPNGLAWNASNDVFVEWSDPVGPLPGSFVGTFYAFDRMADTHPDATTGTFRTDDQLLLQDQAPGIWFFHIVNIDRLGRVSPAAAHVQARIGDDPGNGNIAGTITDATTGDPIQGARITLNGGLSRATTVDSGDFTFNGTVPAVAETYTVTASAPGYDPQTNMVQVTQGGVQVVDFALQPNGGDVAYRLGWEILLDTAPPGNADIALGPGGSFIYSRSADTDGIGFGTIYGGKTGSAPTREEYYTYGARVDVGWTGDRYYSVDVYKCDDNGSLQFGHGWSCLDMRTYDAAGARIDGPALWRNSGQTGSPSVVWNGATFATFFYSYTSLYYRELTQQLAFSNGLDGGGNNTMLAGPYADVRQSARTNALWDGNGYGIVYNTASANGVYFARRSADILQLDANVSLGQTLGRHIGFAHDGTAFHVGLVQQNNTNRDLIVTRVLGDGTVTDTTVVATAPSSPFVDAPSVAFDGRALLVAYAANGVGKLEARDPATHAVEWTIDLPGIEVPRLATSRTTGDTVLLYGKSGGGTYIRELVLD